MSYELNTSADRAALEDAIALPHAYLGQIANGCFMPRSAVTGANRWARAKDQITIVEDVMKPRLGWARWRVASGVESQPTSDGTFIAALEYPAGVFTYARQCLAMGLPGQPASVLWISGQVLFLDFDVILPKDAKPYLWTMQFSEAGGTLHRQGQHISNARPGCYLQTGSGTALPGLLDAFPGSPGEFSFPPILCLGLTRRPSILLLGDSREEGGAEASRPPHYLNGVVYGAVGRLYGVTSCAESATSLNQFTGGSDANRSRRLALAPFFTHVINAWNVNDFNFGRTVAQLIADRTAFAAMWPGKTVIGVTCQPYTPSTDGWRTRSGQSLGSRQPQIREVNRAIRAGIPGEAFILDVARATDPTDRDSWPTGPDPSGDANFAACSFTGRIDNGTVGQAGTILTVTAVASGALAYGMTITDSLDGQNPAFTNEPLSGQMVLEQLSGPAGGAGTYRVLFSQTCVAKTLYVGAWATKDGLHSTAHLGEQVRVRLAADVAQIRR